MYERILVASDGSSFSDGAILEAARLARELGSTLVLFHAVPFYAVPQYQLAPVMDDLPAVEATADRQLLHKHAESEARPVLDAAQRLAHLPAERIERYFLLSNSPYEAILDAAGDMNCDLIVMASHGRRGLAGLLLGSETQKVLAHGKLPVLVVR